MSSRTKLAVIISLAVLGLVNGFQTGLAAAQTTETPAESQQGPALPYIAEINADDVYIRSGPGTNYYFCGKLNTGDRVRVVGTKFSWSQIVPPEGSFSWISKQYVEADAADKATGTVTGDAVRVYAGSDAVEPMHSTTMQLKLNKGDKVKLLGEEKDNYYKIAPPQGAYLWVSTKHTNPVGSIATAPQPATAEEKPEPTPEADKPAEAAPSIVPTTVSTESDKLKEYAQLKEKVEAERAKPISQQDYTDLKKALGEIANDKQAGKAADYAEHVLKQIARYELVQEVARAVKLQDEQFVKTTQRINQMRSAKLDGIGDLGRYAVIGTLQTSTIFAERAEAKFYRIVGDDGTAICYARPTGHAESLDVEKLIGKKVGLVGSIEPYPEIGGALVRFTGITGLK